MSFTPRGISPPAPVPKPSRLHTLQAQAHTPHLHTIKALQGRDHTTPRQTTSRPLLPFDYASKAGHPWSCSHPRSCPSLGSARGAQAAPAAAMTPLAGLRALGGAGHRAPAVPPAHRQPASSRVRPSSQRALVLRVQAVSSVHHPGRADRFVGGCGGRGGDAPTASTLAPLSRGSAAAPHGRRGPLHPPPPGATLSCSPVHAPMHFSRSVVRLGRVSSFSASHGRPHAAAAC